MLTAATPLVSVIMNCRNGEPFVAKAIESVLAQTVKDVEIVFWDNLSTDRSAEIAQSYGPVVRYFRGTAPLVLGAARNEALALARGEFVAILDVDDVWLPPKIELQLQRFADNPRVGLVFTNMVRVDRDGRELGLWSDERRMHRGAVFEQLLYACFITMSTIVVRRSVLAHIGAFNPDFEQVEDWDLYLRIAEQYELDFCDEILVRELVHDRNVSSHYDQVAEESFRLLDQLARRAPSHARACRTMTDATRFKQAGVRLRRAVLQRRMGGAVSQAALMVALVAKHPVALPRILAHYANLTNWRIFAARFR